MLSKLRIGPKLLLAPGLVLMLLIATAAASYTGMVRQNAAMENLVQVRAARLRVAADASGEARYAHAQIYQLLAWVNGSFAQARLDALSRQIKARHASVEALLRKLDDAGAGGSTNDATAGTGGHGTAAPPGKAADGAPHAGDSDADASERKIAAQSLQALAAYRKAVLDTMDMAQMDQSIATNAMARAEQQFQLLNTQLAQLSSLEQRLSEQAYAQARAGFHTLTTGIATMVLLSIALSLGVTVAVRSAMLRDIRAIAEVVMALAAGRLSSGRSTAGRDEIADTARMLDQSMHTLTQTLTSILNAVRSIDTAAHEIASGNMDLSTRTEMQASSLEQTASAMNTLTQAVQANAANAREACLLAADATELAQHGGAAMQDAVQTMNAIRASARQIVDIIAVIDGIAFQTNILALNAAVEAARAGEQGRGFAVVASEVRTLAQRSAAAAKEIKTLIAASVATIDGGSASVQLAGERMGDIVAAVRQVNDIIDRISSASEEQALGIAEVNQAVGQMDDVTQQNAALVEQAAAAAESLQDQAVQLSQAVSVFKIEAAPATARKPSDGVAAPHGFAEIARAG